MHKAAFTPENAAMPLIDHQLGTVGWTHSHDINLVEANALKLAKIAKALDLPVVLTASIEDQMQGPLMPELEEVPSGSLCTTRRVSRSSSGKHRRSTFRDTDSRFARPPGRNVERQGRASRKALQQRGICNVAAIE